MKTSIKVWQSVISVLVVLLIIACSKAPETINKIDSLQTEKASFSKLNDFLDSLDENYKFMASIAIRENGKLIYQYQVGFADLANNKKASAASKYRIGSITKTFTAVLVMQLIEEGKLSLSQNLADFYPQVPNANKITIEHLLSHKSGIFNFTNDPEYLSYMESPKTKTELISIIAAYPSDFAPGAKFEYSNSNYVLLGFIIEDITKRTFAAVLDENILVPLTLNDTYFSDGSKAITTSDNEVKSYRYQGEWADTTETNMSIPHAAGAIVSTASDISLFLHALFNEQLVSAESLSLMKKEGEYGFGLMSYPFYEKLGFGHNGGIDGFVSNSAHFPSDNITIAVLANGVNYAFNDVLIAVLSEPFNKPYNIPEFVVKTPASGDIEFSLYIGEYASEQIPLKIKVFEEAGIMMAQATGQGAFPLVRKSQHDFGFDQAGILMEFNPTEKTFVLNQGGGKYTFSIVK